MRTSQALQQAVLGSSSLSAKHHQLEQKNLQLAAVELPVCLLHTGNNVPELCVIHAWLHDTT